MRADHAPAGADVRERLEALAHVLPAAGDRGERLAVGQVDEQPLDLLVDVGGQQRERLRARLVGRERRVVVARSRARCAARRSPRRARGGARAARPGRRASPSSTSSQPSRAPARYSCRIPSVASIWRPWISYQPASGAMCGKPRSDRKRSSSSSGFTPGSTRRNALRISDSPNTTDEFDCSTPTGRTSTLPAAPADALAAQRKRNAPSSTGTWSPWRIRCSSSRPERGVGQRVVDRPAVGLGDHALGPAVVGRAQPERHLVGLVRAVAEARLDEREHEHAAARSAA